LLWGCVYPEDSVMGKNVGMHIPFCVPPS